MKVLVVDDSRAMRRIMKKALAYAGIDEFVFEAEDGQAALEVVEAEAPDLVLSDVNMPIMGGDVFLDEMKSSGRLATTQVVMVTSTAGARSALDLVRRGATKVLRKPFSPASLHQNLAEFLTPPAPEPEPLVAHATGQELDVSEVEFIDGPPPLPPELGKEAVAALGRVLERSLNEMSELTTSPVPVDTILLATSIDVHQPFECELTLLSSYHVATRICEELTGDLPDCDITRLDAMAELLNVLVGDFVDVVSPTGVSPGMFGLPRVGVVGPGEAGDEDWHCAQLFDPDEDIYLRLAARTREES